MDKARSGALRTVVGAGVVSLAMLAGCAHSPTPKPAAVAVPAASGQQWSSFALPGKRLTRYRHEERDGRSVIHALADASASMYRQRVQVEPERLAHSRFHGGSRR